MITLYHGSNIEVNTPFAKAGRKNLDFGQGFYLTKIKEQAIKDGFRFKTFETYDIE